MKKENEFSIYFKFVIIILSMMIGFFINEFYNSIILSILIALLAGISFLYQWKKSFFNFLLFFLSSVFILISIETSFNLPVIIPLIISILLACTFSYLYEKYPQDKTYNLLLLILFVIIFIIDRNGLWKMFLIFLLSYCSLS